MVRILATEGKGWYETDYQVPKIQTDEIRVKAVLTGVCSSDVAMGKGEFGPLPIHCMGHEGLAQVLAVGSDVNDVQVGDYVATRGEPAYADEYTVKHRQYVRVPEAHPRYILEPVACAHNCLTVTQPKQPTGNMLLIGSGFLAQCVAQFADRLYPEWHKSWIGNFNQDYFHRLNFTPVSIDDHPSQDFVIDLSPRDTIMNVELNPGAQLVLAAEKHPTINTDFGKWLWQAITVHLPSPRNEGFYESMKTCRNWIEAGDLQVDELWDSPTPRSQWQTAFQQKNGLRPVILY